MELKTIRGVIEWKILNGALLSAHVTDSYLVVKGVQIYNLFQYRNILFEILQDIMVLFVFVYGYYMYV